jgi:hypothetical protein
MTAWMHDLTADGGTRPKNKDQRSDLNQEARIKKKMAADRTMHGARRMELGAKPKA